MREVKDVNFNQSFNVLREEFRREAIASDAYDRSKAQAIELMNTMFTPVVSSLNNRYKLRVRFKNTGDDYEVPVEDEFSSLD